MFRQLTKRLPQQPRWLVGKGRYVDAFESLCRLRHTRLQAARDLFFINALLEEEAAVANGRSAIVELFSVARNRRAVQASSIVMFMQQVRAPLRSTFWLTGALIEPIVTVSSAVSMVSSAFGVLSRGEPN